MIPRIVGESLVGRATGTSQALIGLATLSGSAAGGLLVAWSGDRAALLVDAGTFIGLAVVARLVRTRRRPVRTEVRESGALGAGLRVLFSDRLLRILVPSLWVFVVVGEAVNVVEVFLVTDELGLGNAGYGAVGAAQGAGAIAGAWATGRLRDDRARSYAVLAGMAGIGASCILLGVAGNVVTLFLGAIAMGLAGGVLNAATSTLIVTRSAEHLRGRVIAALSGTARTCSIAALLLGGAAGTTLGPRLTFVSAGALGVVAAIAAGVLLIRAGGVRTKDSLVWAESH